MRMIASSHFGLSGYEKGAAEIGEAFHSAVAVR
jgi:hypothetical protein